MNSFKQDLQDHEGLVAWNLAVMGPASGTLQEWGQTIGATDVFGPLAFPEYDNVGTHWFAQTTVDGIPTWVVPRMHHFLPLPGQSSRRRHSHSRTLLNTGSLQVKPVAPDETAWPPGWHPGS